MSSGIRHYTASVLFKISSGVINTVIPLYKARLITKTIYADSHFKLLVELFLYRRRLMLPEDCIYVSQLIREQRSQLRVSYSGGFLLPDNHVGGVCRIRNTGCILCCSQQTIFMTKLLRRRKINPRCFCVFLFKVKKNMRVALCWFVVCLARVRALSYPIVVCVSNSRLH